MLDRMRASLNWLIGRVKKMRTNRELILISFNTFLTVIIGAIGYIVYRIQQWQSDGELRELWRSVSYVYSIGAPRKFTGVVEPAWR